MASPIPLLSRFSHVGPVGGSRSRGFPAEPALLPPRNRDKFVRTNAGQRSRVRDDRRFPDGFRPACPRWKDLLFLRAGLRGEVRERAGKVSEEGGYGESRVPTLLRQGFHLRQSFGGQVGGQPPEKTAGAVRDSVSEAADAPTGAGSASKIQDPKSKIRRDPRRRGNALRIVR